MSLGLQTHLDKTSQEKNKTKACGNDNRRAIVDAKVKTSLRPARVPLGPRCCHLDGVVRYTGYFEREKTCVEANRDGYFRWGFLSERRRMVNC